jgi:hypothetical protein
LGGAGIGTGGIWLWNKSFGDTAQTASAKTAADLCPNCKETTTRSEARSEAYQFAGITPGQGEQQQSWNQFNPPPGGEKSGQVWATFKAQYGQSAQYFGESSGNASVEEHPFGHPDLAGGLNHDCPHFVAVNAEGVEKEFTYKPGSP